MPLPTLAIVSGPPGAGKTTLAHAVADAIGCPAICRDDIKEGMVHARPGYQAELGQDLNLRTLATFFDIVRLLLDAGVTVVAESAFQDQVWRPRLEPLLDAATLRVIRCTVPADIARARMTRRLDTSRRRAAHDDQAYLSASASSAREPTSGFGWITLPVPTLGVDTTDGYDPQLADIVAFVGGPGAGTASVGDVCRDSADAQQVQGMGMTDEDLPNLRAGAATGDRDAIDELIRSAGERGDMDELRRLAADGSRDAVDQLVELAGERGDLDELRRLADGGSRDAADVLAELTDEPDDGDQRGAPPTTL